MRVVTVARKPLDGTVVENVTTHGTGVINVDACRVGTSGGTRRSHQAAYPKRADGREDRSKHWARTGHDIVEIGMGRYPANVIFVGAVPAEASGYFKQVDPKTGQDGTVDPQVASESDY